MMRALTLVALAVVGCGDPEVVVGDFRLELVNFAPHDTQTVSYSLRNSDGFEVSIGSDTVTGGSLVFTDGGVVSSDETYDLYFYADFDNTGDCSGIPQDHAWALNDLQTDGAGDLDVEFAHGFDFTEVCSFFGP